MGRRAEQRKWGREEWYSTSQFIGLTNTSSHSHLESMYCCYDNSLPTCISRLIRCDIERCIIEKIGESLRNIAGIGHAFGTGVVGLEATCFPRRWRMQIRKDESTNKPSTFGNNNRLQALSKMISKVIWTPWKSKFQNVNWRKLSLFFTLSFGCRKLEEKIRKHRNLFFHSWYISRIFYNFQFKGRRNS